MSIISDHHAARYGTHGTAPDAEPPAPASGPVAEAARRAANALEYADCLDPMEPGRVDRAAKILAAEFAALERAAEAMATGLDKISLDQESFTSQDDFDKWIADLRAARLAYRAATGSGQAGK